MVSLNQWMVGLNQSWTVNPSRCLFEDLGNKSLFLIISSPYIFSSFSPWRLPVLDEHGQGGGNGPWWILSLGNFWSRPLSTSVTWGVVEPELIGRGGWTCVCVFARFLFRMFFLKKWCLQSLKNLKMGWWHMMIYDDPKCDECFLWNRLKPVTCKWWNDLQMDHIPRIQRLDGAFGSSYTFFLCGLW
jgi:hypothetical protein